MYMIVKVITLSDRHFNLELDPDTTIKDIKAKIKELYKADGINMPIKYQKLNLAGSKPKVLSDKYPLSHYVNPDREWVTLVLLYTQTVAT